MRKQPKAPWPPFVKGGRAAVRQPFWTFGIFAILYLFVSLDPLNPKEKRSLLLLMAGYVLIFLGGSVG
ncbi:MAG: hypothetical protein P1P89_01110 [Desulfobacterales bacterium]|nr:hypothetical protein [Desulfobacterales bacterium]